MKQPFVITSPELGPTDREYWIIDPDVGPRMGATFVGMAFYGWKHTTFNTYFAKIREDYPVPFQSVQHGRRFSLYDVERISRLFLNRGIIDYRKFYSATQVLKAMGSNYGLI